MGQFFGKLAVVGKKKNSGSIPVKTANRINSLRTLSGNQVKDCLAVELIVCCGYAVLRLVHQYVNLLLSLQELAVHPHLVCTEHLCTQFGNNLTVDCNDSLDYVLVGFPA